MAPRRVIASPERSAADAAYRGHDPELGARRREGLLLVAYAVLFVIGVWTVAVSELVTEQPSSLRPSNAPANVPEPTQSPSPTAP